MAEKITETKQNKKKSRAVKIIKICGIGLLYCILLLMLLNALLCIFAKNYYPTFGKNRLFAIVSDSMEPEIPTGNMIVCRVPDSENEIEVGTVITYEYTQNKIKTLITHRVTAVHRNDRTGEVSYTTRGDNAPSADAVRPKYSDVVGIYTGQKCAVLGYIVGFLQSTEGAIALIITGLIAAFTMIMVWYVNKVQVWRNSALSALEKVRSVLTYAQIEELKTIADVVGIVTKDPEDNRELKRKDKKLEWFLITGSLPKRPYRDDLCPTDDMSSNIEEKIKYLHYGDDDPEVGGFEEEVIESEEPAAIAELDGEALSDEIGEDEEELTDYADEDFGEIDGEPEEDGSDEDFDGDDGSEDDYTDGES